ncbi:hypothetical protein RIF29_35967 [Crotalaria pallida]|uniref:Protein POLLEN DEFECTIVE IN GUIDANCE 1 n=1 Tax=Crotalaria pallida TaxID=3830 RepID=A0AAN9HS11_CROPI
MCQHGWQYKFSSVQFMRSSDEKHTSQVKVKVKAEMKDKQPQQPQPHHHHHRRNKKKKRNHKASLPATNTNLIISKSENGPTTPANDYHHSHRDDDGDEIPKPEQSKATTTLTSEGFSYGELRQRSVNSCSSGFEDSTVGDSYAKESSTTPGSVEIQNHTKELFSGNNNAVKSPVTYFLEELYNGNSLRTTTTLGNEKGRERVYDTIFRLPWRCELLINVGFFVCFNSFLSLLTVMPTRIAMTIWKLLKTRKFNRPSTIELSDFGCFLIMACGVTLLHQTVQAITLSTCIVAHNNALPALLVSNNFAEIKSFVFKKYNKDNVHSLVYFDSIERFHTSTFILFYLAQNILEAEGTWFQSFLIVFCVVQNIFMVYLCEMAIDIIKHSFIAKFNNIKPSAFSEFLEDLCKQTLNMQTEDAKQNLTFIPVAPACVVIRVLTPVYAANLPFGPLPWRLLWILLFLAMTYILLTSLKVLIGMVVQKHATWYVSRCQWRKHHAD